MAYVAEAIMSNNKKKKYFKWYDFQNIVNLFVLMYIKYKYNVVINVIYVRILKFSAFKMI